MSPHIVGFAAGAPVVVASWRGLSASGNDLPTTAAAKEETATQRENNMAHEKNGWGRSRRQTRLHGERSHLKPYAHIDVDRLGLMADP